MSTCPNTTPTHEMSGCTLTLISCEWIPVLLTLISVALVLGTALNLYKSTPQSKSTPTNDGPTTKSECDHSAEQICSRLEALEQICSRIETELKESARRSSATAGAEALVSAAGEGGQGGAGGVGDMEALADSYDQYGTTRTLKNRCVNAEGCSVTVEEWVVDVLNALKTKKYLLLLRHKTSYKDMVDVLSADRGGHNNRLYSRMYEGSLSLKTGTDYWADSK
jgi:hypothetical protein